MSAEPLWTSDDLATYLGVSIQTLAQWVYLGKGPPVIKVGKHRRYRRTDVEEWLEANTHRGIA